MFKPSRIPMSSALVLVLGTVIGCAPAVAGSGVANSELRPTPAFTRVSLKTELASTVSVGSPQSVHVRCDDNLVPLIRTEVRKDTLEVWIDGMHSIDPKTDCKLTVSLPKLTALEQQGSGGVHVSGLADGLASVSSSGSGKVVIDRTRADDLEVDTSGSGGVDFASVEGKAVHVRSSGSGSVRLSGRASKVVVGSMGSGSVDAERLSADSAVIDTSGSGNVSAAASTDVTIDASGSGRVHIVGNPAKRHQRVTGSGRVSFAP